MMGFASVLHADRKLSEARDLDGLDHEVQRLLFQAYSKKLNGSALPVVYVEFG